MKSRFVKFLLSDHKRWGAWSEGDVESIEDLGKVTVVELENEANEYEYYKDAHIVFKVEFSDGSIQFFQMNGQSSSYSTDWDGSFYEVKGTPKTVLVYERIAG